MKIIDVSTFNWKSIQNDFDSGLTLGRILEKYNIKRNVFNRARNSGYFKLTRNPLSHKHSEETKKYLSDKRKEYLSKNKENHNWSKYHKESIPCKLFKEELIKNNISFIEEYQPLENRFYKIDIAFPDRKIGIEINGNQHYNLDYKTLKPYYRNRKDLMENSGWKLFDFHYTVVYKKEKIDEIIAYLLSNDIGDIKYLENDWIISKSYKNKKRIEKEKAEKLELIENRKKIIIESNIDFSKFGWVGKVASLLGCVPQHVSRWMKKYMPDFYNKNCFKRSYV